MTGSGGFIGSHLVARLLSDGHEILAIDNFNNYYSPDYKRHRFNSLTINTPRLTFHSINLIDFNELRKIAGIFTPEIVIHLAGQAGVRLPASETYKYIEANIVAFTNVLNMALNLQTPRFLYASSSSVYGNNSEFPLRESQLNLQPVSFYGSTKLANEFLAERIGSGCSTKIIGLRFFSVYGPWGRPDMAYFKILKALYTMGTFELYGDGSHIRDMTHIDDVVTSIERLATQNFSQLHSPTVVNIGGGHPHSLRDLISVIEDLSHKRLSIVQRESSTLDVSRTEADFTKLQSLTGYVPKIDILEGAESLIKWISSPGLINYIKSWNL